MSPKIRTLLLGAGISGVMAFLAPRAHAIDGLILEEEQPAAHNGDDVRAVGFAADGVGGDWVISGGEDAKLRSWTLQLVEERVLDVSRFSWTFGAAFQADELNSTPISLSRRQSVLAGEVGRGLGFGFRGSSPSDDLESIRPGGPPGSRC